MHAQADRQQLDLITQKHADYKHQEHFTEITFRSVTLWFLLTSISSFCKFQTRFTFFHHKAYSGNEQRKEKYLQKIQHPPTHTLSPPTIIDKAFCTHSESLNCSRLMSPVDFNQNSNCFMITGLQNLKMCFKYKQINVLKNQQRLS